MSVDVEVRREYYEKLRLDLLLQREAATEELVLLPEVQHKKTRTGRGSLLTGMLLGAAASLLFVLTFFSLSVRRDLDVAGDEPSASGFAILSGQSNAVWAGEPISVGSLLPEGELHLKSGVAYLELFSGVQMVVHGEALFSIDSPMQVAMQSGRARALVPEPAQGFRVKTANAEIVDLGTEFAIDVDESGSSVQVVEGEVELQPTGADARRIHDSTTLKWHNDGTIVAEPGTTIDLIGPTAFQNQLAQQQSDQFRRWQEASRQRLSDPRLIAYYQVDPNTSPSRRLENLTLRSVDRASEGAVVAAERAEDRWGRNGGALDFSRMGSRVRVAVPGEHRGLTLTCWVKINSLDRLYNSLFLTDGHEEREPHWQIMDDGRIFFSVKLPAGVTAGNSKSKQRVFYSPSFWSASHSGRWIMISTTYDVDTMQVTHYVNGVPISNETIPPEWLVASIKIGSASICNWSEPMYRTDPTFVVRNLNGSLDEFALFSGALSLDEIKMLYQAGNPHAQ